MSSASVIIHKQNKYINIFNELGAIDEDHSIDLNEVGIRKNYVFIRMCDRGVFVPCNNGRYYINNQAAILFKENRRKRALTALVIVLIIFAVYFMLGGR